MAISGEIRRFQINPILSDIKINEKIPVQISCVEILGPDIYIGTADSFILLYADAVAIRQSTDDQLSSRRKPLYKYLGLKRSITQMLAIPVLNRLLTICDNTMMLSNLDNLDGINNFKIRNVWACSMNEKPTFSGAGAASSFTVEICLAKRKSLSIAILHSDRLTIIKEIPLNEQPLAVAIEGNFICVACTGNYFMIDSENNSQQILCPNEQRLINVPDGTDLSTSPPSLPFCKYIGSGEFLINGPSHLGVFVKTSGISERPPVDWGPDITHIAYCYPYILCLRHGSGIVVISLIDQRIKEEFPLPNGTFLGDFDGKIFTSNADSIWQLQHISWAEQIESLLVNGRCQEAIDLMQSCCEISNGQPIPLLVLDSKQRQKISIRAGLIELERENFPLAIRFLSQGDFDPRRALIRLNPVLAEHVKLEPIPVPETDQIQTLLDQIREKIPLATLNRFLLEYLSSSISDDGDTIFSGTVQLLIRLQDEPENLNVIRTLLSKRNYDQNLIEKFLKDQERNYHLALLYSATERADEAIELILKLERGTIGPDRYYSGDIDELIPLLARFKDPRVLLKHIHVFLNRNQRQGAEILIAATDENRLAPDTVIPLLQPYREALVIYLEYLVFEKKIPSESVHTTLVLVYIEILSLHRETEQCSELSMETKKKLDQLLNKSPVCFDQRRVLTSLIQHGLDYETATLYGQMGQHRKAFDIYLGRYQDHRQSLKHCLRYDDDVDAHQALFETYMDLYRRNGPETLEPLLEYLNHGGCRISLSVTIPELPDDLKLNLLRRNLSSRLGSIWHERFQTDMGRILARSSLETERKRKNQLMHRNPIRIDGDSLCTICQTRLLDSHFVWIPGGNVAHDFCYYGISHTLQQKQAETKPGGGG